MSWDVPPAPELPGPRGDLLDDPSWRDLALDVPAVLDVLPDGREAVVLGDAALDGLAHQQGDNPFGFRGTCGLCSCEGILRQFGVDVTEADVVDHAVRHGLCFVGTDLDKCGGTRAGEQVRILGDFGIPAHADAADSVEDLAQHLEHGRGVILHVNAGALWDDDIYSGDGGANHAVLATRVARDPESGAVLGVFVNDSSTGDAGRLLDIDDLDFAWLDAGGGYVVTDVARTDPRPTGGRTDG